MIPLLDPEATNLPSGEKAMTNMTENCLDSGPGIRDFVNERCRRVGCFADEEFGFGQNVTSGWERLLSEMSLVEPIVLLLDPALDAESRSSSCCAIVRRAINQTNGVYAHLDQII